MQPEFPDEDIMALFEGDQEEQNGKTWTLLFDGASNVYRDNADIFRELVHPNDRKDVF